MVFKTRGCVDYSMALQCPRCGGTLITYTLEGKEAVVCEECEFVNVPTRHATHSGDGEAETESWDEVLERYREGE